jgi:hypothetical protein
MTIVSENKQLKNELRILNEELDSIKEESVSLDDVKILETGTSVQQDITWYIKWISSIIVIVAVACRSIDEVPKIYDVVLSFIGCVGWTYVGLQWRDRALIVLNAILSFVLFASIFRYIFQ